MQMNLRLESTNGYEFRFPLTGDLPLASFRF